MSLVAREPLRLQSVSAAFSIASMSFIVRKHSWVYNPHAVCYKHPYIHCELLWCDFELLSSYLHVCIGTYWATTLVISLLLPEQLPSTACVDQSIVRRLYSQNRFNSP